MYYEENYTQVFDDVDPDATARALAGALFAAGWSIYTNHPSKVK